MVTLETILSRENLNMAWRRVKDNKGSAGVDGMTVTELPGYLREHAAEIVQALKAGRYKPQPVRRVLIPKEEKGKYRPLGIPTAIDRFVQQAVAQVLSAEYETVFSRNSHGFRPLRSCRTAVDQALRDANEGYVWVVDVDLAKFFDTVNHSKLLQILSERVKDGRVISLIHKMLRAPIAENGQISPCEIGTPQGGPVSPVLANIMLNELDHELERRGHRFVRYADDMMILCRSRKAAERTLSAIRPYIERNLFLKLNEQKTKICHICDPDLKFLGFGFWFEKGVIKARPHQKSKAKLIQRLRQVTSRSRGQSLSEFRRKLAYVTRGWGNYFRGSSMKTFAQRTDEWLRRRIRQICWKQWKTVSRRRAALMKLGVSAGMAWMWANSRLGSWRIAGSQVLNTSLTNKFLKRMGWVCLGDVVLG